jgi:hypothetical protein
VTSKLPALPLTWVTSAMVERHERALYPI